MWRVLNSIADRGRELLTRRVKAASLEELCQDLLSQRGEAIGTALARDLVDGYRALNPEDRLDFFEALAENYPADFEKIVEAAETYSQDPRSESLLALWRASEPPVRALFGRINMAPGGTGALVDMRRDLLDLLPAHPELKPLDSVLRHLLTSWFNRGFLVLKRIDWQTPAFILEKVIEHEAVHEIDGWDDLRRRLDRDRRCFAFFHPALLDDPLIFVEVALTRGIPDSMRPLLDLSASTLDPASTDTAVFYSISNCLAGLRGISFGNFLIKQVVAELLHEELRLKTFVTLSPIPGFSRWLEGLSSEESEAILPSDATFNRDLLDEPNWQANSESADQLREPLLRLCAHYLVNERRGASALDPVATFHLGDGASVERINWLADTSGKGLRESAGLMVNYLYQPSRIERNHEVYVNRGRIAKSPKVGLLLRKK